MKFETKKSLQRRGGFSRPLGNSKNLISALKVTPDKRIGTNLFYSRLFILVAFVQQRHNKWFRALTEKTNNFLHLHKQILKKLMHRKELTSLGFPIGSKLPRQLCFSRNTILETGEVHTCSVVLCNNRHTL